MPKTRIVKNCIDTLNEQAGFELFKRIKFQDELKKVWLQAKKQEKKAKEKEKTREERLKNKALQPNEKVNIEKIHPKKELVLDKNPKPKKPVKIEIPLARDTFIKAYQKQFKEAFNRWAKNELEERFHAKKGEFLSFSDMLISLDKNMKTSMMAIFPQFSKDEDLLSKITFGGMSKKEIDRGINELIRPYSLPATSLKASENFQKNAYEKVKDDWDKKLIRNITQLAFDQDALSARTREENIEYLCALNMHKKRLLGIEKNKGIVTEKRAIGEQEVQLIDDAMRILTNAVGFDPEITLGENVSSEVYREGNKLSSLDSAQKEKEAIEKAYKERKKDIKADVADFEKTYAEYLAERKEREKASPKGVPTDEALAENKEFLQAEELRSQIENPFEEKEPSFLDNEIDEFNKKYGLDVSGEKFRSSIRQLSVMMVAAQTQKQSYLDPKNVVMIEDGKEKVYTPKEFLEKYKEFALQEEGKEENKEQGKEKAPDQKEKEKKVEELEKSLQGRVFEKNGKVVRSYKASEYYETHETTQEYYAYGEYQKLYARLYKNACEKAKENNYAKGKVTDFGEATKDVERLFRKALFETKLYDDEKNREIVEKCSHGGFTTEQLSNLAKNAKGGAWAYDQMSDAAWNVQNVGAKKLFNKWNQEEKKIGRMNSLVDKVLLGARNAFERGKIDRRTLLEHAIAGEAHFQNKFNTKAKRFFSFLQHNSEKYALLGCRMALGLKENDSLRVALNKEYVRLSNEMTNEKIFQSVSKAVENAAEYKTEKENLAKEHADLKAQVKEERQKELEKMQQQGREPIQIPELDERKNIVNAQPKSKQIEEMVLQANKALQNA